MGSEKLAFYMYGKTINNLSKRETLILGQFLYQQHQRDGKYFLQISLTSSPFMHG